MARAVARQSQMDPKVYIPLLENFESIVDVSDLDQDSVIMKLQTSVMKFKVNLHLKRHIKCIESGLYALEAQIDMDGNLDELMKDNLALNISDIIELVYKLTLDHNLYLTSITILSRILSSKYKSSNVAISSNIELGKNLLRRIKIAYGDICTSKQLYAEAITSYLSADPPSYQDAIKAARSGGDWQKALLLVGRQAVEERKDPTLALRRIAAEIVLTFKESVEQGGENDNIEGSSFILPSYLVSRNIISSTDISSASSIQEEKDRAVEVAQISLDYCDDTESAVAILLSAKKWSNALQTCIRKNRSDLLEEEVRMHIVKSIVFNFLFHNDRWLLLSAIQLQNC
jgi:hypothetical protein